MKIIESEQFKNELKNIAYKIKKDKPKASINFVKKLKNNIKNLVNFPYKYRQSIYFDNVEITDMVFYGYTIIYEIRNEDNTLEVLTIFNQNLPTLQSKEQDKTNY